jgi:CheY-like chemotaxis protein
MSNSTNRLARDQSDDRTKLRLDAGRQRSAWLHTWLSLTAITNGNTEKVTNGSQLTENYELMKSLSSNFMSPLDQKLAIENLGKALSTSEESVDMTISDVQMSRMSGLWATSRILNNNTVGTIMTSYKDGMEKREDGTAHDPMMMWLPEEIMVGGKPRQYSLATMQDLIREKTWDIKRVLVSDYVTHEQKNRTFGDDIRITTSAPLAWSKSRNYRDQLTHQKVWAKENNLENNYEISERAYLEMLMLHFRSPSAPTLLLTNWMRLNIAGTDRRPLGMGSNDDAVGISRSPSDANSNSGIGASSSISLPQ